MRIGDNTSILQAGESSGNGLLIRTGGSSPTSNRIEISSNGITFSENINMTTGTISNVGNAGGDWTSNRISIGDAVSTLTAGGTISLGVDLDLNGHSIIGLPDGGGDSFPIDGEWTEGYLRIGNGNSILQAGDATDEILTIRTGGNLASNTRLIISTDEVDFFENLNLNNNDLLNVGNSGGDWTENNLSIGSGNTVLTAGGDILINPTEAVQIRPGDSDHDVEIYDTSAVPIKYAYFDTTERDFIVSDGTNSILRVDTSAGDILIRDALTGVDDTDTGLRFVGADVLNFYAGSLLDADARMSVEADLVQMYQNLDMNNNQILNLDTSNLNLGGGGGDSFPIGGVWTENYLQIGTGTTVLYGGDTLIFRTNSNDFFGNRMSMNNTEIDMNRRLNMNNNTILNVGNTGGDWTANSLSIGNAASTLTAGGTISLGVDLDLNGNSIIGLAGGGDSFPDGGEWTENYLRIGTGNTVVLDAGDAITDEFKIRLNNVERLSIENDNIGVSIALDMQNNDILNVGSSAGNWSSNRLSIGSGASILTSAGSIGISSDNDINILRTIGSTIYAKFDVSERDFIVYDSSGNSVFQVDSSADSVLVTGGYYHLGDTDTGVRFSNNTLDLLAGNTTARMTITTDVNVNVNLDLNNNNILNVGDSGGDWSANNLQIGSGNAILRAGGHLSLRSGTATTNVQIQDETGDTYVTFDTSANSVSFNGPTNQVLLIDTTDEELRVRDTILGVHDPDTGIHWAGQDELNFYAGSTSGNGRMAIRTNQIDMYEDLDMNGNQIINFSAGEYIRDTIANFITTPSSSIFTLSHNDGANTFTINDKITFSTDEVPATLASGQIWIQVEA